MAPSRRKGASKAVAAAAAHRQWKVGDLVLAKVKGFPAWPATVSEPEKWGYSTDWKKVLVYFFGTQQMKSESPIPRSRPNFEMKEGTPKKQKQCNCKHSKCLKLEDPIGDSQEMSHSAGRADSGSKIGYSTKAESVESGEKISQNCKLPPANSSHPSRSCNANIYSGNENTKEGILKDGKSSFTNNCALGDSDFAIANGIGPSKGESNYEEAVEFDPIVHHNQYCPWVNGNVAAAGCASSAPSTSGDAIALCGWQLTLDALDALRSLGNNVIPMVQSESAASLYKNDQKAPSEKLLRNHSMSRSHGQL